MMKKSGMLLTAPFILRIEGDPALEILAIVLYEFVCGTVAGITELPMFLFPNLSRTAVVLSCCIGKGLGAYSILLFGTRIQSFSLWNRVRGYGARLLKRAGVLNVAERVNTRLESFVKRNGFPAYLLLMSVPFAPMRSTTYAAALLGAPPLMYAIGAAIGTAVRNLIVYYLIYFGYMRLTSIT